VDPETSGNLDEKDNDEGEDVTVTEVEKKGKHFRPSVGSSKAQLASDQPKVLTLSDISDRYKKVDLVELGDETQVAEFDVSFGPGKLGFAMANNKSVVFVSRLE